MRAFTPGRLTGAGTPFNWPQAIGYDRAPFASLPSGAWRCVAGPAGLQLGIFGWADPNTGQVSNSEVAGGFLGFVLPVIQMLNWQRCYRTRGPTGLAVILRAGLECVLAAAGDFITTFPLGAQAGQRVYADPVTGAPYGGNPGSAIATPWTVMENACHCNAKVRISSFTQPFQ